MEKIEVHRGNVFYANLDPIIGCEQGGFRPILIIQNNIGNSYSKTVIAASITCKIKEKIPTHIKLQGVTFLTDDSIVLLEQIKTIDKRRLIRYMGSLDASYMKAVDHAISISVGLIHI